MASERDMGLVFGPRTTVHEVVTAYPFLVEWLPRYHRSFWRLTRPHGTATWARIATLGDLAVEMNVTWRRLVRDVAAEIVRETGREPVVLHAPRTVAMDDPRLAELQEIGLLLESGAPLLELADRLTDTVESGTAEEGTALEAALSAAAKDAAASSARLLRDAMGRQVDAAAAGLPEGHPLDALRREGAQIEVLSTSLRAELERLAGSSSRRRWRAARPLVARLVERLSGVESRVRREQQAWLPALAEAGAGDAGVLLRDKRMAVLDALRLSRLAVRGDDPARIVECGSRLLECLAELSGSEEHVLVPIAAQTLSEAGWAAVRELEDGVGWSLIPRPPPWPAG